MAVARALALPGEHQAWEPVGFAPGEPIGDVALAYGAPALELAIEGLQDEAPDGLPLLQAAPGPPAGHGAHPNGALVIDHVVALTDDMDRTLAALGEAGLELRRERHAPARQAFLQPAHAGPRGRGGRGRRPAAVGADGRRRGPR